MIIDRQQQLASKNRELLKVALTKVERGIINEKMWSKLIAMLVLTTFIAGTATPAFANANGGQAVNQSAMPLEATGEFHSIREFQDGENWVHEYLDISGDVVAITVFFVMTSSEHREYHEQIRERGYAGPGTMINRYSITVRAATSVTGAHIKNRTGIVRMTATIGSNVMLTALTAANEGQSGTWGEPGWTMRVSGVERLPQTSASAGTATFYLISHGLQSSTVTIRPWFGDGGIGYTVSAPSGGSARWLGGW